MNSSQAACKPRSGRARRSGPSALRLRPSASSSIASALMTTADRAVWGCWRHVRCPQGDRAAQARADKVGGRGVERVDDREGVGDVLIPAVQRRVGTTRCSRSSNIRHRNAITAGKSVGKRSHAVVIGPTAVQHDDQLAAADDLAHEGPAVIPDVQRSHHQLPLPMSALSGIPRPRRASLRISEPGEPPLQHTLGGYTVLYTHTR